MLWIQSTKDYPFADMRNSKQQQHDCRKGSCIKTFACSSTRQFARKRDRRGATSRAQRKAGEINTLLQIKGRRKGRGQGPSLHGTQFQIAGNE